MTGRILATIPGSIDLVFQGNEHSLESRVDDLMADRWLEVLLREDATWQELLGEVLPDQHVVDLADAVVAGLIPTAEVVLVAQNLLTAAAGRPWWETFNILAVAEEAWESIGGELALKGVLPGSVTLGAWLDAAWQLLRQLAGQQGQQSLTQLVSEIKREPFSEGDDGSMDFGAFMTAAGELRGPMPG